MNARQRPYLFGIVFLAFGFYKLYEEEYLEFSLYSLAGLAFIFNQLAGEPRLFAYKKALVIITWALIIATALVFFYLLRFRFF
jgi:hypothetical protein